MVEKKVELMVPRLVENSDAMKAAKTAYLKDATMVVTWAAKKVDHLAAKMVEHSGDLKACMKAYKLAALTVFS